MPVRVKKNLGMVLPQPGRVLPLWAGPEPSNTDTNLGRWCRSVPPCVPLARVKGQGDPIAPYG
jgi:hypothetical protein